MSWHAAFTSVCLLSVILWINAMAIQTDCLSPSSPYSVFRVIHEMTWVSSLEGVLALCMLLVGWLVGWLLFPDFKEWLLCPPRCQAGIVSLTSIHQGAPYDHCISAAEPPWCKVERSAGWLAGVSRIRGSRALAVPHPWCSTVPFQGHLQKYTPLLSTPLYTFGISP